MSAEERLAALVETLKAAVSFEEGGAGGYNASAEAMVTAGVEAFNWAASEVGATGFQASWAALSVYSKVMHVDCPFLVIKLEDALYPQSDLPGRLRKFIEESRAWLIEQAQQKLAEYEANPTVTWADDDGVEQAQSSAHPDVVAHWRRIIAGTAPATSSADPPGLYRVSLDAAIEAAAKNRYEAARMQPWDEATETSRENCIDSVREIVTTAVMGGAQ